MPVRNFSAGPSRVPAPVLDRAAAEMRDYRGSGLSFMELSHRDAGGPVQALMTDLSSLVLADTRTASGGSCRFRTDAEAVAAFMREFRARWWYLAAAGI